MSVLFFTQFGSRPNFLLDIKKDLYNDYNGLLLISFNCKHSQAIDGKIYTSMQFHTLLK